MKRNQLLFVLLFTLFAIMSQAQIRKGAVFLGGNISGYTEKTTSSSTAGGKQNGITVSPVLGIASKENMVWGGSLNLSVSNYSNDNAFTGKHDYSSYGAGVF